MRDASAFEGAAFLGLARTSNRDVQRLDRLADHLDPEESARVLLPTRSGTLLVTDRRILELRTHLEVHGAWNVRRFAGFEIERELRREEVSSVEVLRPPGPTEAASARPREERLRLGTADGPVEFLVSRGPEPTLTPEDIDALRRAVLGPQPK